MTKRLLYMGRPPDDEEARLEWVLGVYRRITGKEPTPEDVAAARHRRKCGRRRNGPGAGLGVPLQDTFGLSRPLLLFPRSPSSGRGCPKELTS